MIRLLAVSAALLSVLSIGSAASAGRIDVLTQNQYLGADVSALLTPSTRNGEDVTLDVVEQIAASRIRARLRAQASEIRRRRPDVVALQEVFTFRCVDDPDAPPPPSREGCGNPRIAPAFVHFLGVTRQALGGSYAVAARVRNIDTRAVPATTPGGTTRSVPGVPFQIDGFRAFLVALGHEVVLVRRATTLAVRPVRFAADLCRRSLDGCTYEVVTAAQLNVAEGTAEVAIDRSFVGIDLTVRGTRYRVVNTQLEQRRPLPGEPSSAIFQSAQALQLATVLVETTPDRRVIVTGDLASRPDDRPIRGPFPFAAPFDQELVPAFQFLTDAGLADTFALGAPSQDGFTCCQDSDLRNQQPSLTARDDAVLSLPPPDRVPRARVVGGRAGDRTRGVYPSDHAGVLVSLRFP